MSKLKILTWVKAGYEVYGREGIEGVRVERLARSLSLNKSGFYHYFGSMRMFIETLLQYHVEAAKGLIDEIRRCDKLDPDVLHLMVRNRYFFLVEAQLLLKPKPQAYVYGLHDAGGIINKEWLPLWTKAAQLPDDPSVALSYLNLILHFFYAGIGNENFTYEFLQSRIRETGDLVKSVLTSNQISHFE